jgi:hypothetical protein
MPRLYPRWRVLPRQTWWRSAVDPSPWPAKESPISGGPWVDLETNLFVTNMFVIMLACRP